MSVAHDIISMLISTHTNRSIYCSCQEETSRLLVQNVHFLRRFELDRVVILSLDISLINLNF